MHGKHVQTSGVNTTVEDQIKLIYTDEELLESLGASFGKIVKSWT
jgi:hypothetical protein